MRSEAISGTNLFGYREHLNSNSVQDATLAVAADEVKVRGSGSEVTSRVTQPSSRRVIPGSSEVPNS